MFQHFEQKYKKTVAGSEPVNWKNFESRVPDGFVAFMERMGAASFDNGFIWTVDPLKFEATLADWNLDPEEDLVVARTGVGDLFLWNGEGVYQLDCNRGTLEQVAGNLEILFDYFLCDQDYLDAMCYRRQFQEAIEGAPPLQSDQCLQFVPALALGGPDAAANLERAGLSVSHHILSQIHVS